MEHSWNTRGTSWNTSDPWGLYSSVGSAHKHSWNTRGTRLGRRRYGKPGARPACFCGWSPVRIPVEHGFAFFQADHRFESGSCKKIFQVVMGSNPGLGTLLTTFAVVTGSSPGRAKRWSFYRMFYECSTSVRRVFHECSTSVGSTLVEHRGVSWSRGTPVEHPWNIVDPDPPAVTRGAPSWRTSPRRRAGAAHDARLAAPPQAFIWLTSPLRAALRPARNFRGRCRHSRQCTPPLPLAAAATHKIQSQPGRRPGSTPTRLSLIHI